ncbi:MAG: adenosylcobinamide-GDP ribazoletransferase [Dehalococcoidia bacterium]|nr:adenosylcobinamide-GDP ribazoletransferase [Dehalococcoidia bacterium]MDD5493119.1 adenosylcobinamide-GDP ribazoletransferase [Dehalococcoidia bacterium]
MDIIRALRFLTIIPVPYLKDKYEANLGKALAYFPLIGLLLGSILAVLNYLLLFILPSPVISILLIAALAILTGAHHIDGLVDTCDAMAAGKTREERLAIMSDKRVGTFGIVGACLLLLTKYVSLNFIISSSTLLVMPVLSRWTMASSIVIFPSAKPEGMGFSAKKLATWRELTIATVTALVVAMVLVGILKGLILCAVLFLLMFGFGAFLNRHFGGLTGDCYGAINEIGEVLSLILIIILTRSHLQIPDFHLPI